MTQRITCWARRGAVLAGLLLLTSSAHGAKVKGKVTNFHYLENPVWKEAKDPKKRGYSFREPVPTVGAKYRKLFPHIPKELCITLLASADQKPPKPILITVGGGRTTPVTIVVPPGTQLTFKNTDPFKHRLYAVKVSSFSASDMIPGATRDWRVPKAGVFEIRDELAPSVRMWVIAEPKVATISYPDLEGEFLLNAPDGEYTLQAFFAGKKVGPAVPVSLEGRDLNLKKPVKVAKGAPKDDKKKKKKK